ncbi:MAG TPA: CARDB domain-containing protein [Caulifigura sp.]|nr:CARDB domain-containing protein [Caulifigura sp.]
MRRTAWILAALGLAGSTLHGYAQETARTSVPVRRAPAKAAAETTSTDFYDDLFGTPQLDEPDSEARPKVKALAGSMDSSQSIKELLTTRDGSPSPAAANDAFPTRRQMKPQTSSASSVSAAALFEASDRPTGVKRTASGATLKAEAPNAIPDEGPVVPVAGTGKSVSTSLTNRNQRIEPSKHTAAPTDVDQHLLMIGELPVDPKAPAAPPRSSGGSAASELPELDFSTAAEDAQAEATAKFDQPQAPASTPTVRKRPESATPKFNPKEPAPNWDDEPGDAELLDNPFAKFVPNAKEPAAVEDVPAGDPFATAPAEKPAFEKRAAVPPQRKKSPLLEDEPAIEEPAAPAKRPLRNPSTNPLMSQEAKGTLTIPSSRRPAVEQPSADIELPEPAAPMAEAGSPVVEPQADPFEEPPVKPPVRTVKASPPRSAAPSLLDLPAAAPAQGPAAAVRQEYITSTPEKSSNSGATAEWVKKSEIAIGQECLCELVVKNRTDLAVRDVEVEAYFPANVQLVGTAPSPTRGQSSLIWKFESLNPGEAQTIAIRMVPRERGNIATQAYVRFSNAASGSFSVAEPMLAVELAGPHEVMIGETASHTVTIRNPGTGTAANVKVEARIPQGLEHSRGSRLMLDLGSLNPGESRPVRLALAAVTGGRHVIEVKAHADGDIVQAAASEVMVVAPRLKADVQGPGLRYLGRRAVYTLSVTNDGSANTENVRVMHKIPEGFEYVSSDKGATYSAANRMLSWYVGTMNTGETAQAHVTLEAKVLGAATHFIRATSEHGVVADAQVTTQVEGTPSLVVEITDLDDPVETGVETGYEIRVKNEGSAPAERVALNCELPMGCRFVSAAGAVSHAARGQMVEFRPIGRIAPGETVKYQVLIRGEVAGNLRFRTHLTSDSITDPLTSEELTKFYE